MGPAETTARVFADHRDGEAVVIKRARPGGCDHLRAEAELLWRIRHPGVVRPLAVERCPQGLRLVLAHAGSHTLEMAPPVLPSTAAVQLAQIAATVAHLHAHGTAHGNLSCDHVVLSGRGRARLCGFGTAAALESPAAIADARRHDLAALASLAMTQLDRSRLVGSGPARRGEAQLRARLRRLLTDHSMDAATLAERVGALAAAGPPPPTRSRTRRRPVASAVLALAGTGFSAAGIWQMSTGGLPEGDITPAASASAASPPDRTPGLIDCSLATGPCGELDAGGQLPEPWEQFRLSPNDAQAYAVADWDCDDTETLAVVSASGQVHIFDQWPDTGSVRPRTWQLPSGEPLRVPGPRSCGAVS